MADSAPAGAVSYAKAYFKELVSQIPWFQAWTGTANAAAAKDRIKIGNVVDGENEPARPFITVAFGNSRSDQVAEAAYLPAVELRVLLEADISAGNQNDHDGARTEAEAVVDTFVKEVLANLHLTVDGGAKLLNLSGPVRWGPDGVVLGAREEQADNANQYELFAALLFFPIGGGNGG